VSAHQKPLRFGTSGDAVREDLLRAMVSLAGTHGYPATTIDAVCGLAEVSLSDFRSRFADMEECYLEAYDQIAAEFGERVLGAYEDPTSWHDSMWAAGWAAIGFLQEDPARARFYAVEVNVAGDRARVCRDRVMQVFADLVDAGRNELDEPQSISRATAEIVAGAIYNTIQSRIMDGTIERREDFLVELVYIAVLPYLGAEAAEAELRVQPLR
jgi:AcrR family transcriptional regulator